MVTAWGQLKRRAAEEGVPAGCTVADVDGVRLQDADAGHPEGHRALVPGFDG